MIYVLYQIFNIILNIFKKHEKVADYYPITIYVNKIEHRVAFKIRTGYYLDISTFEMVKLRRSTEKR